jgi:hypothetical protein
MRSNSDPTAALLLCLRIAAGLWTFFKGFRVLRECEVLEDTPCIAVRSVPMGLVHVRGKAQSEQVLSSPVSHSLCCFYKVEIDPWDSSGKSHSGQRCCTDMDDFRFYLADETGTVLIDSHAAEYDLPVSSTREVNSYQGTATSAPVAGSGGISDGDLSRYVSYAQIRRVRERVGQFVDKRIEKTGAAANRPVQAKQEALKELFAALPAMAQGGQPSTDVMAKLTAASGPLSHPEKEQRRQVFLAHLQEVEFLRQGRNLPAMKTPLAQPATGRYRLRECLVVPGQEYLIRGTCGENSAAAGAHDLSLIGKGQHEPTFVISTRSDAELNSNLRRRAGLMILGGAALALVCLTALLVHFHLFQWRSAGWSHGGNDTWEAA